MVHTVDADIFARRYFGLCMRCGFCADACCQHGVDVSLVERDRILARADEIETRTSRARDTWFEPIVTDDVDFPGGAATRTTVVDGRCVFLSRDARGCTLHALSLEENADYHLLKPMVSTLFPVTFGDGVLLCSDELTDGSLVCVGDGPTAYEMARTELAWYFGEELVAELDALSTTQPVAT
ncbi:MAG: YkgJ family cysteine cluster protein [Gemmatimonadota bacterium]|nr:YkgJ family cysteine cluster protein [Gemmatimonadota bacterium]